MTVKDLNSGNDCYFSIEKNKDGTIFFMMDDCECVMKPKDAKRLLEELRKEILK